MKIKPNTILKCGEMTFRVIERLKNDTIVQDRVIPYCLKDYEMVGYRCENIDTNEIMVIPMHKSLEKRIAKGQKKNGDKTEQYILW